MADKTQRIYDKETNTVFDVLYHDNGDGTYSLASYLPGGLAGYAEDAAHTTGDKGLVPLSVRQDVPSNLSGTDGDYQPLITGAYGQLHVGGRATVKDYTLVLDGGNAYADGDVLAITASLGSFFAEEGGSAYITGVQVLDEDNQGQPFDLLFFDAMTSIGTLNNAAAVDDAGMRALVGWVDVNAADYVTWFTNVAKTALIKSTDAGCYLPGWIKAAAASRDLFVGAISRGTGTYTGGGLKLKISVMYP